MKVLAVLSYVLFVQDVLSDRIVTINKNLDHVLEKQNSYMAPRGNTLQKYDLFNNVGYVVGLNSVARKSDAVMKFSEDNRTVSFDFRFGYNMINFVFGELVFDGQSMSAVIRVQDNAVHIAFEIIHVPLRFCKPTIQHYEVEPFEGVTMESTVPRYNGMEITDRFNDFVRPLFALKTSTSKKMLQGELVQMFCATNGVSSVDLNKEEDLEYALTQVVQAFFK